MPSEMPDLASSPKPGQARPPKAQPSQDKALIRPMFLAWLWILKAQAKPEPSPEALASGLII